jgi:hypothetical protein
LIYTPQEPAYVAVLDYPSMRIYVGGVSLRAPEQLAELQCVW